MEPLIVVSAERFFRGGTVKMVGLCLQELSAAVEGQCRIRALVYQAQDYPSLPNVEYVPFPKARKGWWRRLYYEYVLFPRLARGWKPVLWLSLQDSTPPVCAPYRAVYFHHPLLFARLPWSMWLKQPALLVLKWLYRLIYLRNIASNQWIFVQQHQLRQQLLEHYALDPGKVWVIPPVLPVLEKQDRPHPSDADVFRFIYPAYPYVYKNHAVLFAAAQRLWEQGLHHFELICTWDTHENAYIRRLRQAYSSELPIHFTGYVSAETLALWYSQAHALVFPSLCETWGLPLSEAASRGLPILAADLPYARETLAGYPAVCWLPPTDEQAWAQAMKALIQGNLTFAQPVTVKTASDQQMSWLQWIREWLRQVQDGQAK